MPLPTPLRRVLLAPWLASAVLLLPAMLARPAWGQDTPVKFQLDWRFEGPSALFLVPLSKGFFRDEKLAVTVDAGNGSGNAVNRVASGAYDMGFADLAALMEFHANNPDAPNKPVAVMMVYNNTPAAVISLKKSGIKSPAELSGKRLGAPVFDAGRRAFPIFQVANSVGAVHWVSMDPPLRESMLIRGEVDAITGFDFTSLLNLEARGIAVDELTVMRYAAHGVNHYGSAIIVGEDFLKRHSEQVKAFLRAFAKGTRQVIADPKAAILAVRERDSIINVVLEERRLRVAIEFAIATPDARTEGFGNTSGPRLALMAQQVGVAYATRSRVIPAAIWNGSLLPSAAERDIFSASPGR